MKYAELGLKKNGIVQKLEQYFPLHNGIVVELPVIVEMTEGGIHIPQSVKNKMGVSIEDDQAWKVVKIGPECVNIKVGDWIMFSRQTPIALMLDNKLYYQFFENFVVGLFRAGAKSEDFKKSPAIVANPVEG